MSECWGQGQAREAGAAVRSEAQSVKASANTPAKDAQVAPRGGEAVRDSLSEAKAYLADARAQAKVGLNLLPACNSPDARCWAFALSDNSHAHTCLRWPKVTFMIVKSLT